MSIEKPPHLIAEARRAPPTESMPSLPMNSDSEEPKINSRELSAYRLGRHPGQQQAGNIPEGELVATARNHVELVRPVDAFVLKLVAGVAARQAAQRQPREGA